MPKNYQIKIHGTEHPGSGPPGPHNQRAHGQKCIAGPVRARCRRTRRNAPNELGIAVLPFLPLWRLAAWRRPIFLLPIPAAGGRRVMRLTSYGSI
jgi:hypothetical protein